MFVGVPYDCLLTLIVPSGELPAISGNYVFISEQMISRVAQFSIVGQWFLKKKNIQLPLVLLRL